MKKFAGVSSIEIAMLLVVLTIISLVAFPRLNTGKSQELVVASTGSEEKVRSAFALAIAQKGDYPTVAEVLDYVDADFATEVNDLSGIIFREDTNRLTVNTFSDEQCRISTNPESPGVTDVVRCIKGTMNNQG